MSFLFLHMHPSLTARMCAKNVKRHVKAEIKTDTIRFLTVCEGEAYSFKTPMYKIVLRINVMTSDRHSGVQNFRLSKTNCRDSESAEKTVRGTVGSG